MSDLLLSGTPLDRASTALVLVHGRGATAESIVGLGRAVAEGVESVAFVAPQAPGGSWYPNSFLAPLAANEPYLSRAVGAVVAAVEAAQAGGARVVLGGFSQGACLALEVAARHGARLGLVAAFGLSGGLIGTDDASDGGKAFEYADRLDGLPVFAGVAPDDPHIPLSRFEASRDVFERLVAAADFRVYPGLGHAVNADEAAAVRALLMPGV